MMRGVLVLATALSVAAAPPAVAQGGGSRVALLKQRVDEMGRYGAAASICEGMGYGGDPTNIARVQQAAIAELQEGGLTEGEAIKVFNRSIKLHTDERDIAAEKLARSSAKPETFRAAVAAFIEPHLALCEAASADPVFSRAMVKPANYDRAKARIDGSDSILWLAELASWQTPEVIADGRVVAMIGACQKMLGETVTQAKAAPYINGQATPGVTGKRAQDYFTRRYAYGVALEKGGKITKDTCDLVGQLRG